MWLTFDYFEVEIENKSKLNQWDPQRHSMHAIFLLLLFCIRIDFMYTRKLIGKVLHKSLLILFYGQIITVSLWLFRIRVNNRFSHIHLILLFVFLVCQPHIEFSFLYRTLFDKQHKMEQCSEYLCHMTHASTAYTQPYT